MPPCASTPVPWCPRALVPPCPGAPVPRCPRAPGPVPRRQHPGARIPTPVPRPQYHGPSAPAPVPGSLARTRGVRTDLNPRAPGQGRRPLPHCIAPALPTALSAVAATAICASPNCRRNRPSIGATAAVAFRLPMVPDCLRTSVPSAADRPGAARTPGRGMHPCRWSQATARVPRVVTAADFRRLAAGAWCLAARQRGGEWVRRILPLPGGWCLVARGEYDEEQEFSDTGLPTARHPRQRRHGRHRPTGQHSGS